MPDRTLLGHTVDSYAVAWLAWRMKALGLAVLEAVLIFVIGTGVIGALLAALSANLGGVEVLLIGALVIAFAVYRGIRRYRITQDRS